MPANRGRCALWIVVLVGLPACSDLDSPEAQQQLTSPQPAVAEGCGCQVVLGVAEHEGFARKNLDDGTWTIGFFAGPDGDFVIDSVVDNNDDPWSDKNVRCEFMCSELTKLLWLNEKYGFIDAEDGSQSSDEDWTDDSDI